MAKSVIYSCGQKKKGCFEMSKGKHTFDPRGHQLNITDLFIRKWEIHDEDGKDNFAVYMIMI